MCVCVCVCERERDRERAARCTHTASDSALCLLVLILARHAQAHGIGGEADGRDVPRVVAENAQWLGIDLALQARQGGQRWKRGQSSQSESE